MKVLSLRLLVAAVVSCMESSPHILDVAGGGGVSVLERWSRQLAELSRVSDEFLPSPACDFSNAKHSRETIWRQKCGQWLISIGEVNLFLRGFFPLT